MANVLVEETSLSNIASAIREKSGGSATYKPGEMAAAISNLPTGGSSDNENLIVTRPDNINVTYVNHEIERIGNRVFQQWTNVGGYGLVGVDCSNVRTIGDFAFYNDFLLTSVNFPKVTGIRESAFDKCTHLPTINLPMCNFVGNYGISNCTALTKVDLGNGSNSNSPTLRYRCFWLNENMTALILRGNEVFTNEGEILGRYSTDYNGYIYVPQALLSNYKNATNWAELSHKIRAIEDYPDITGG